MLPVCGCISYRHKHETLGDAPYPGRRVDFQRVQYIQFDAVGAGSQRNWNASEHRLN